MRKLRYQPSYWNYLMGNFIDNISKIRILQAACRFIGRQILSKRR